MLGHNVTSIAREASAAPAASFKSGSGKLQASVTLATDSRRIMAVSETNGNFRFDGNQLSTTFRRGPVVSNDVV
jgi:hypothetical protein